MKALIKTLGALAIFASAAWLPIAPAQAAACTATGQTLGDARDAYARQCPNLPRADCDPNEGRWICSSETIGANGLGVSDSGASAPVTQTPVVPTPLEPTPIVVPVAQGGACEVSGATIDAARRLYASTCSAPRVDCDPSGNGWRCASYEIVAGAAAPVVEGGEAPQPVTRPQDDDPDVPANEPAADEPSAPLIDEGEVALLPRKAAGDDSSVVKVPLRLENLYKYNVNAITNMWTTVMPGGIPTQFVTFYDTRKRVHIASREFPHGEFSRPIDIDSKVHPGDTLEPDSHNSTGVAVAPDGTIFVTANHHVDELNLARTSRPYDLNSFVNVPANELGRGIVERITYPSFFKLNGYLWLSAREQDVGGGTNFFMWYLWRYNHNTGEWDIKTRLNGGQRLRLYVSNIDWSADESEIHLLGVWREEQFRTGLSQNTDLFHLTSRDGKNFRHVDGTRVDLPLVWRRNRNNATSNDNEVPKPLWNTSAGDPQPYQPGSVVYDGSGAPHMLIKEMENGRRDTWHHRWDEGANRWRSVKPDLRTTTDDLVKLPDGRVGMIGHAGDTIYFLDLSTPGAERVLLSKGYHTSAFEVNVGKTEMRYGYLSIWLTKNKHDLPGRLSGSYATDAWVMTIALDELSDFDNPVIR